MLQKYLPTTGSKVKCSILVTLVLCIYIISNSPLPSLIGSQIFNYIIKPCMWLGLALFVWCLPQVRPKSLLRFRSSIYGWVFTFAVVFIVVSVLAGLIDGLGKSPYNHSPRGILTNLIFVGTFLLGSELSRSYITNSLTRDENYLIFILISLFMTIVGISFNRFLNLEDHVALVQFLAEYLAPGFAKNLFATYLVFLGGPLASIIYLGSIEAFHWLSPVLPDLKWITTALIGILCPVFFLSLMQNIYLSEAKLLKRNEKDEEGSSGWIITSIVSIAIVWFTVGVFPIYPSVIVTGSMEPMIKPGDVILVDKIQTIENINSLEIEDVIQFRRDDILISHRIIGIVDDGKIKSFYTKGDNNSSADSELVKPEQVKGKIIKVIPKIGWPTLLIKSNKSIPLDEIVF